MAIDVRRTRGAFAWCVARIERRRELMPTPPDHPPLLRAPAVWAAVLCLLGVVHGGSTQAQLASEQVEQPPTHADLRYGPDERQALDFWAAAGDGPRPLVVIIHGGGWINGDKRLKRPPLAPFLDRGISVAAINYRLAPSHPLPAPVYDAARAIQFLRWKGETLGIDPDRIGLTGTSAGACTSMWLLLHDDLADPAAADPVLRASTRVRAAAVSVGQTSIDPDVIESWLGPAVLDHPMIFSAVGEPSMADVRAEADRHRAIYEEFSPINHVDGDDPPLFMACSAEMDLPARNSGHGIHHPLHGVKLKERSDAVGHECHLLIPGWSESKRYADGTDFLLDQLLSLE
jgi:acetyl esterase/lipase